MLRHYIHVSLYIFLRKMKEISVQKVKMRKMKKDMNKEAINDVRMTSISDDFINNDLRVLSI